MTDPWTDPDPQPGDFDAELATIDPGYLETHHGDADATQKILVSVEGRDAKRLERLATARGKKRATASRATGRRGLGKLDDHGIQTKRWRAGDTLRSVRSALLRGTALAVAAAVAVIA